MCRNKEGPTWQDDSTYGGFKLAGIDISKNLHLYQHTSMAYLPMIFYAAGSSISLYFLFKFSTTSPSG